MSGPKCYAYTMADRQREVIERLHAARGQLLHSRLEFAAAEAEAGVYGILVHPHSWHEPAPEGEDAAVVLRTALDLAKAAGELKGRVAAARQEEVRKEMALLFPPVRISRLDFGEQVDVSGATAAPVPVQSVAVREQLEHLMGKIAGLGDDRLRRNFAARAAGLGGLLEAEGRGGAAGLSSLRSEVAAALREERKRLRIVDAVQTVFRSIAHIQTGPADDLRQRLEQARTLSDCSGLAVEADKLRIEAQEVAERSYVATQARAVLEEMGYTVGDDFSTLAETGQPAVVPSGALGSHGLRIHFPVRSGRMLTNVVAMAATSQAADTAAEQGTCVDLGRMAVELRGMGISMVLEHEQPAGTIPVERVAVSTVQRKASAKNGTTAERGAAG